MYEMEHFKTLHISFVMSVPFYQTSEKQQYEIL